mgnify:CR=1 FL=1
MKENTSRIYEPVKKIEESSHKLLEIKLKFSKQVMKQNEGNQENKEVNISIYLDIYILPPIELTEWNETKDNQIVNEWK